MKVNICGRNVTVSKATVLEEQLDDINGVIAQLVALKSQIRPARYKTVELPERMNVLSTEFRVFTIKYIRSITNIGLRDSMNVFEAVDMFFDRSDNFIDRVVEVLNTMDERFECVRPEKAIEIAKEIHRGN